MEIYDFSDSVKYFNVSYISRSPFLNEQSGARDFAHVSRSKQIQEDDTFMRLGDWFKRLI